MRASRHAQVERVVPRIEDHRPSVLETLLDDHFGDEHLAAVLGLDSPEALELSRRALLPPLVDFLARPGKQIRSRLVNHAFAIAHDILPSTASKPLGALTQLVEMLHAGSLIVDDVEDDAIERRGAPALHRTHGLPIALNAGNWLYFWPSLLLCRSGLPAATLLAIQDRVALTLVRSHHGQALDLSARVTELSRGQVRVAVDTTTQLKTGALFELSARLGALGAHATPTIEDALGRFGREVGCVLQMYDVYSAILSPARLEKACEDLRGVRPTWPWATLAGLLDDIDFADLQAMARGVEDGSIAPERLVQRLRALLPPDSQIEAKRRLDAAIFSLREAVGDRPSVDRLIRDVRALEHVYAHA
jgi:geranylgeranyl pyrophosphate synthase